MPDQSPAPELSTLHLPTEHLSSLLTMRTWVKTTLEEERQRCLELTAELEQRQAKIVWLEQTLETTEKILPDTLPPMPIAESPATIDPAVEPAKPSSSKQSPKAPASKPASQKQATSKQPSAAKPVAKAPVTKAPAAKTPAAKTPAAKASKHVPTPQSISKATSKAAQSSAKTPQQTTPTTSKPSEPRQFSIRDVPFLAPYKNNLTVTQAIKALLDDHPDEAMDITQIIERLFGAVPKTIQEQVRRRVTTDLSSGKNTFWRSVPGKRGFYRTLVQWH